MLDVSQLSSIGFRFVRDSLELMTPYGEELARHPRFYTRENADALRSEQRSIALAMEAAVTRTAEVNALMRLFMPVKDIRRSVAGVSERTLSEVELFEIKRFLMQLDLIAPQLEKTFAPEGLTVTALPAALDIIDPDGMRSPSFYVSDRLSPRLAAIRAERRRLDDEIRKNGLTDELSSVRTRLAADEEEENFAVRTEVCRRLAPYAEALLKNAEAIGRIDLITAKARLAVALGASIPNVGAERFRMTGMKNPRFALDLEKKGLAFVPVSLELEKGSVVVTGANMGGKSVAIKTLALNAQLAMCGYPVFAENCEMPFLDDIYLLSEDREDVTGGLSSFGGEMKAFDTMLRETADKRSVLVLLDEFARGTNPHEGAALVRAAVRLFNARGNTYAVVATHFDGAARLARLHYQVAGLRNADAEKLFDDIRSGRADALLRSMDYGLYPVSKDEEPPRDAVKIIKALGVSREFSDLIDISDDTTILGGNYGNH